MTRFARVALGDRVSYARVDAELHVELLDGTPLATIGPPASAIPSPTCACWRRCSRPISWPSA